MVDIPNDDEETKRSKKEGEGDSESGSASTGTVFQRASGEGLIGGEQQEQRKKRGEGDSESGSASTGTTFVRASGEGIAKLSVEKQKQVWTDFRKLDLGEAVAAIAEFFSEFPARASANISVAWNKGGFAIVNMAIKFGQDVAMAVRERTRESAVQVRRRYGINLKFKNRGGVPTNIPNPQAGLQ